MQLDNMANIRRKRKISRVKMAKDLGIDKQYIKELETTDKHNISREQLVTLSNYLNVAPDDLFKTSQINHIVKSIPIPSNVDKETAIDLFNHILDKYSPVQSEDEFNLLLEEFKYRLGDIPEKQPQNPYKSTFNLEDYFNTEFNLNVMELNVEQVKRTAKMAAIIFKELKNNDLTQEECLNILQLFIR